MLQLIKEYNMYTRQRFTLLLLLIIYREIKALNKLHKINYIKLHPTFNTRLYNIF